MLEQSCIAFFTATILEWKHLLRPDKYKQIILDSLAFLVENKRIQLYGFVIMPNHIHLLWKMQEPFLRENVQRDFLKFTAQQIKFDLQKHHPQVLEKFKVAGKDRVYQIWERNALSVYCYGGAMINQKLTYIHNNPVVEKWKLADLPEVYPFSSANFYLKNEDNFGFLTHYLD
ncbi:MAG: transposase [Verrucomicrobia bacterium]|nr:transposase [Cytophagales bacterium]